MNKDNFEGGVRSAVGQGERFVGSATDDKASEVRVRTTKWRGARSQRGAVLRMRRRKWPIPVRFPTCLVCATTSQS